MRRIIFSLALFLFLAACAAPQAAPTPLAPSARAVSPLLELAETQPEVATEMAPTEATAVEAEPQPVPTSRGNALAASDPAQVNLNAGRPALVEFFRFT
jgi:hypothetical protein